MINYESRFYISRTSETEIIGAKPAVKIISKAIELRSNNSHLFGMLADN